MKTGMPLDSPWPTLTGKPSPPTRTHTLCTRTHLSRPPHAQPLLRSPWQHRQQQGWHPHHLLLPGCCVVACRPHPSRYSWHAPLSVFSADGSAHIHTCTHTHITHITHTRTHTHTPVSPASPPVSIATLAPAGMASSSPPSPRLPCSCLLLPPPLRVLLARAPVPSFSAEARPVPTVVVEVEL